MNGPAKLHGKQVVASISGGKDSAALSLWLTEQGIEHLRVFLDTGWENRNTYAYVLHRADAFNAIMRADYPPEQHNDPEAVDDVNTFLDGFIERYGEAPLQCGIGDIVCVRSLTLMDDLVHEKGTLPSRQRRFCTEELKVFPMQEFLGAMMDAGVEPVNCVGIRAAESEKRSKMPEWEFAEDFDCYQWRPLIKWSEQDVIDIHQKHGLRPNPLYLQGASRVGCWPCIMARKAEVRLVADIDPRRINRLRVLENDMTRIIGQRNPEKGEKYAVRGWFQDPNPPVTWEPCGACAGTGADAARDHVVTDGTLFPVAATGKCQKCGGAGRTAHRYGEPWPIDRIVEWARDSKSGEDMYGQLQDAGCMRWGLCEKAS